MDISRPVSLENVADPSKMNVLDVTVSHPPRKTQTPPGAASDSESSPHRPMRKTKLAKTQHSSEEDSNAERKNPVVHVRNETTGGGAKTRGTRQPIKRGGKRF